LLASNKDENDERASVVGLETGQGKSSLIAIVLAELYKLDRPRCGSIVLVQYQNQCDSLCDRINRIAGTDIAAAYHSKSRLNRKQLLKYPMLAMTHQRFLSGIENLNSYACWIDSDSFHKLSNSPVEHRRHRLIIDESINKIDLLSINNNTLLLLDVFFQNQQNKSDFKMWQRISNEIREMLVLPVLPSEKNVTEIVKLSEEIPKRLIDVVLFGTKSSDKKNTQRAFKSILNLANDGGILKTSTNPEFRKIQTASYINIFSPLFTSVILDGTCRTNETYNNEKYFHIVDIPRTKTFENVTVHVENKTTGSRSSIGRNDSLVTRTIDFINQNLTNKDVLLICHKNTRFRFSELPENVDITHWGAFSGSNEFNKKDCIVYCGVPHMDETYYVYLFHIFSGDRDFNRDRTYKPSGSADPVVRFIKEPNYERMRQSWMATEIIQSINRGICRNHNSKVKMHAFLPYNDLSVLKRIEEEMPGVVVVKDYKLIDNYNPSSSNKGKKTLVESIVDILVNHRNYFGDLSTIKKNAIFDLEEIKSNYRCSSKAVKSQVWKSSQVLELENDGYLEISKKRITFLKRVA